MAEDLAQPDTEDGNDSLEFAAEQITALMGGAGTGEQPAAADPEPAQQAQAPAEADPAPVAAAVAAEAAPVAAAPAPIAQAPAAPVAPQTAPAAAAATELQKTLSFAKVLTGQLQQQLMGEFSDITSDADVYKLMENPERYNRFAIAITKMQSAQQQVAQLEQQHKQAESLSKQEQETQRAQARAVEGERLGKLIQDLNDKDKGPKLVADLRQYAQTIGVKPERMADYTADEFVALHKAMQFDAAKAAEASSLEAANKKASKAPPVQQPGTRIPGNGKAEKMQESFTRLQKTGREDDAAAVFAQLLS